MQTATKTELGVGFTVTFTRHFSAPRDLVFKLWTDPAHLAKWWGPAGFTNPVCEFDARAGGHIYIDMRAPDGTVYPMEGTVEEILPPERLVLRCTCCGDDSGEPGIESITTVTFETEPGGTRLVVEARVTKAEAFAADALAGMEQGWSETLDRLADAVKQ
ncbi:MAG: SRPBCC domain-containing protein [Kiloniellaceae bacterium]|nr:SRPBCC domain-containing protein [Kiloniellaceae bacterium]